MLSISDFGSEEKCGLVEVYGFGETNRRASVLCMKTGRVRQVEAEKKEKRQKRKEKKRKRR